MDLKWYKNAIRLEHSHREMIVRQLSDVIDKYCIICISLYSQMCGYVVSTVPGPSAEEVGLVCKVNFDASFFYSA